MITPFLEKLVLAGEATITQITVGYGGVMSVEVPSGKSVVLTQMIVPPFFSFGRQINTSAQTLQNAINQALQSTETLGRNSFNLKVFNQDNTYNYVLANPLQASNLSGNDTFTPYLIPQVVECYCPFKRSFAISINYQAYSENVNLDPVVIPAPLTDGNQTPIPAQPFGYRGIDVLRNQKLGEANTITPLNLPKNVDTSTTVRFTFANQSGPLDSGALNPIPFKDSSGQEGYFAGVDCLYPKINLQLITINSATSESGFIPETLINKYK